MPTSTATTKTMTNLCALVLVARGQLDPFAPVARYWPEFAANGKEGIEVRHLLSHTSGVSGWEQPVQVSDIYDWERSTSMLAAQAPWWEPGTKSGYHGLTQGYLVGEVVRQVTGHTVGQFFASEIGGPMGADFHIGLDPVHDARVAPVIPPSMPAGGGGAASSGLDKESVPYKTWISPRLDAEQSYDLAWRRAEIPAAGGHGNARGVALAQAAVSCPEVNGVSLLSRNQVERIFDEQSNGPDMVIGDVFRFGVGWALSSPDLVVPISDRSCFWGGWGGSLVVNDVDRQMTMAFVMNRMGEGTVGDERSRPLLEAATAAVDA